VRLNRCKKSPAKTELPSGGFCWEVDQGSGPLGKPNLASLHLALAARHRADFDRLLGLESVFNLAFLLFGFWSDDIFYSHVMSARSNLSWPMAGGALWVSGHHFFTRDECDAHMNFFALRAGPDEPVDSPVRPR
jgi:hypothetical protein